MSPKDLSNLGLTITEIKSQLLITATQLLETYVNWFGKKADVSQSLSWPRTNTDYLDSDIPKPVKLATFELANYLAKNEQLTWTSSEISQAKVGPINVSFNTEDAEFGIPSFISKLLDSVGEAVTKRPNAAYSIRTVRV